MIPDPAMLFLALTGCGLVGTAIGWGLRALKSRSIEKRVWREAEIHFRERVAMADHEDPFAHDFH